MSYLNIENILINKYIVKTVFFFKVKFMCPINAQ